MRAFVFTDPALASEAGRFVWLEINTEKAGNAPVTKRLAVNVLPTFFVLNPADESVAIRWIGGANLPQLEKVLADGRGVVAGSATAHKGAGALDTLLARGDRLYGAADWAGAATAYASALKLAPPHWPHYSRVVESLLFAYSTTDQNAAGVALAREAYPKLRGTPSSATAAGTGLDCATSLPDTTPGRAAIIAEFETRAREVLAEPGLKLAGDDRSGLYISLLSARQDAKDSTGAHSVALAWSAALDSEAAHARTPAQRAVYDPHRLSAYIEVGTPEKAVPMLEASERDFPDDYNPPQRLATAYKAMKRWDDALAASDRAMQHAYGPRKLLLYNTRYDILMGRGDATGARRTLEDAIAFADALPPGQRSERSLASLRKKLAALDPGAAKTP